MTITTRRRRTAVEPLDQLFGCCTLDQAIAEIHRAYRHLPAPQQRRAGARIVKKRVLTRLRRAPLVQTGVDGGGQ